MSKVGHLQLALVIENKTKSTDVFNVLLDYNFYNTILLFVTKIYKGIMSKSNNIIQGDQLAAITIGLI